MGDGATIATGPLVGRGIASGWAMAAEDGWG